MLHQHQNNSKGRGTLYPRFHQHTPLYVPLWLAAPRQDAIHRVNNSLLYTIGTKSDKRVCAENNVNADFNISVIHLLSH